MGRHHKGVAEALAMLHRAAQAERAWHQFARTLPDDEKRKLFRQWWAAAAKAEAEGRWVPRCPPYLRGLTCGARTRAGTLCKRIDINRGGRCKYHGGMSTGPRSAEGKAVASRNGKRTPCTDDK